MNKIRDWLFIGSYRETADPYLLQAYSIGAMLQLADNVPQDGIISLYLPIDDGVPLQKNDIVKGVAFVQEQKTAGKRVLIACGAGISRSVSLAVAALKEEENLSLMKAMFEIRKKHPTAMPHPTLWASLCEIYGEEIPYLSIWKNLSDR